MNISHDEFSSYYLPYIQLAANQDIVLGLKENVILGRLIPAGTGLYV
mgnify:CR=1 FL=1